MKKTYYILVSLLCQAYKKTEYWKYDCENQNFEKNPGFRRRKNVKLD